jgi:Acetyltransferase (GNAT) family
VRPIYEFTESHVQQLHHLYQKEWWTKGRSLEETRRCIAGSQVCVGLVDDKGDLTAFARVVTDFTFKALIFDVIVSTVERSSGLGERVIRLIKDHDQLRNVRHFELYCLPELYGFYRRFGFSEDVGEIRLMRCVSA